MAANPDWEANIRDVQGAKRRSESRAAIPHREEGSRVSQRLTAAAALAVVLCVAAVSYPSWSGRRTLDVPCSEHRQLIRSPVTSEEQRRCSAAAILAETRANIDALVHVAGRQGTPGTAADDARHYLDMVEKMLTGKQPR